MYNYISSFLIFGLLIITITVIIIIIIIIIIILGNIQKSGNITCCEVRPLLLKKKIVDVLKMFSVVYTFLEIVFSIPLHFGKIYN